MTSRDLRVVEEWPYDFLLKPFNPVVSQELTSLVLADALLVLLKTVGEPDAREAVTELNGVEVERVRPPIRT